MKVGIVITELHQSHKDLVIKWQGYYLPASMMNYGLSESPRLDTEGVDRVRSSAICEELRVEPLLLCLERSQSRWFGLVWDSGQVYLCGKSDKQS